MSDAEKKVREVHPGAYLSGNSKGRVRVLVTQGKPGGGWGFIALSGYCPSASAAWEKALRKLQGGA